MGSGNSIPEYMPFENYFAMNSAVEEMICNVSIRILFL